MKGFQFRCCSRVDPKALLLPRRILIVRTSAIGDVVFASPIVAALKRSFPDACIAWLVEPVVAPLLEYDPGLDARIVWPKAEWAALWRQRRLLELLRAVLEFRRMLRAQRFDTVLDLQGLFKSGFLAWLTGAGQRIGLGSREGSQLLMTRVIPRGGNVARISSEYLHMAEQLGLDVGDFLPTLHLAPDADHGVRSLLAGHGLAPGRYAVFAAFTTRPQKHWFEDAWQTLAPKLAERTGLTPVLLGGPADAEAAARIAAGAPGLINLVGRTKLPEAAALVRGAGLLVGVDTGLTHMGIAFATPTVAIFGSTCPYTHTGRANARVIWLGLQCSPCKRRPTCGGAYTCLRDITPDRVLDEAAKALAA